MSCNKPKKKNPRRQSAGRKGAKVTNTKKALRKAKAEQNELDISLYARFVKSNFWREHLARQRQANAHIIGFEVYD